MRHRPLLYIETSVFGFYFDMEPRNAVRREAVTTLLNQIRLGILEAGTSPVTFHEFEGCHGTTADQTAGLPGRRADAAG